MKYQMAIQSNEGYGADQVKGIKAWELKEMIEHLDDDDEIVLYDLNNGYGAQFGKISGYIEEALEEV